MPHHALTSLTSDISARLRQRWHQLSLLRKFLYVTVLFTVIQVTRGILRRRPPRYYHASLPTRAHTGANNNRTPTPAGRIIEAVLKDPKFRSALLTPINPTPWLWGGRLQTLFTILARFHGAMLSTPLVEYDRELLVTKATPPLLDGQVAIDYVVRAVPYQFGLTLSSIPPFVHRPDTPTVIVCHGLAGGSFEHYVQTCVAHLSLLGYRCVVFNQRGCGKQPLISPQSFTAGYTEDLRQAVRHIQAKLPDAPLSLVGFSLGANLVTKYVGEEGASSRLLCCVAVANPWDLLNSSRILDSTLIGRYVFSFGMAQNLKTLFAEHRKLYANNTNIDWEGIEHAKTIRDFDRAFLIKQVYNYETPNHYYRENSSASYLTSIKIPFLGVHCADDPICSVDSVPLEECMINEASLLVLSHCGGHSLDVFVDWKPRSWAVWFVAEFIDAIHRQRGLLPADQHTPASFQRAEH